MLQGSFPFDARYADMASERQPAIDETTQEDEQHLLDLAQRISDAISDDPAAVARFLAALPSTEPYAQLPNPTARILHKLAPMNTHQQLIERSVIVSLPNDRLPTEDQIHELATRLRVAFPVSDEEFAEVLHRITAKILISMESPS